MTHVDELDVDIVKCRQHFDVFATLEATYLDTRYGPESFTVWEWVGEIGPIPRRKEEYFTLTYKLDVLGHLP